MVIIAGSTALNYHGIYIREAKDKDVLLPLGKGVKVGDKEDKIYLPDEVLKSIPHYNGYTTLNGLYTLKCSHLAWDIKWQKHKNDVLYLKAIGCKIIEPLYGKLVQYWKEVNGNKKFLNMYKKKSDFFNDYVPYIYDHDYLHELVAYPNKPMYVSCLKEGEDVAIDKGKFDQLTLDQQLRMFREEISVIAAERWLIPPKLVGKYSWRKAYSLALHKTVTALTKNWASDFIIRNLDYFVKPDIKYFKHLFETIKEGEMIMGKKVDNWEDICNEVIASYIVEHPNDKYPPEQGEWYYITEEFSDFGEFKRLEQEGGCEGGGEYCYCVFQWRGKIYKLDYAYYSHHGTDFDDATMYEVEPIQKMVTVYE